MGCAAFHSIPQSAATTFAFPSVCSYSMARTVYIPVPGTVAVLQLEGPLPRLVVGGEYVALLAKLQRVVPVGLAHVQRPGTRLITIQRRQ